MSQDSDYTKIIENNLIDFIKAYNFAAQGIKEESSAITLVDSHILMPYFNGIICTRLNEQSAQEIVEELTLRFKKNPYQAYWWIMPSTTPTSLGGILESYGCTYYSQDVGMALELSNLDETPKNQSDLTITAITTEEDIVAWLQVYKIGFQLSQEVTDDYGRVLRHILQANPQIGYYYLARYQGEPVATSSLFITRESAGIYEVSTLPNYRNKGFGTEIVLAALQAAKQHDIPLAVLQSTNLGITIYKRLGFQIYCTIDAYLI